MVSGLAAIITLGFIGGSGGMVSGLAAITTPGFPAVGFIGGSGGMVNGLAAITTVGFIGGSGGIVSGLAAIVTVGFIGGSGGIVKGLAIAHTATAAIAATKTTLRIWILLGVIIYYSLRVGTTTHTKSNPKGSLMHHKSNIAGKYF